MKDIFFSIVLLDCDPLFLSDLLEPVVDNLYSLLAYLKVSLFVISSIFELELEAFIYSKVFKRGYMKNMRK